MFFFYGDKEPRTRATFFYGDVYDTVGRPSLCSGVLVYREQVGGRGGV